MRVSIYTWSIVWRALGKHIIRFSENRQVSVAFFIGKICICIQSLFFYGIWHSLDQRESCSINPIFILTSLNGIFMMFLIGLIQALIRPTYTTDRHSLLYIIMCGISFIEYTCYHFGLLLLLGMHTLIRCPNWKNTDPFTISIILIVMGGFFMCIELFTFVLCRQADPNHSRSRVIDV